MQHITPEEGLLKITVEDGGYISGEPLQGRTATDGVRTTFTAGDVIGVFTVVNGEIKQNNVGMLYSDDAEGWVGKLRKEDNPEAKYFAYYPWQENLTGDLNPNAEDAAGFFAGVISAWTPSTNQSTYHEYTAQDLMVGSGSLKEKSTLGFTLTHQMGLVVIQMPVTKYKFINSSPTVRDYTIPAKGTFFDGFQPCLMFDGNYRYLVKAGQATTISGGYLKAEGGKQAFNTQVTLNSGVYKKFKIDKGIVTEKTHLLQPGDYFMKDGSLVGKDTELTAEQKGECLGIVYWIGDATLTDPILKDEHPNCMHALVCSVHSGNVTPWQDNASTYNQTVQHWVAENTSGFRSIATGASADDNMNQIMGYNNTRAMEMFNKANRSYQTEIIDNLNNFKELHTTPSFTSGWYVPSVKELYIMMNSDIPDIFNMPNPTGTNYEMLSAIFTKLGKDYADQFCTGTGLSQGKKYYSSSEHNVYKVWVIGCDKHEWEGWPTMYDTSVGEYDKGSKYYTRFILAF